MAHENEDTLLELALGLLNPESESRVRTHLRECPGCRSLCTDVEQTVGRLKVAAPALSAGIPALPSPGHGRYAWLRVAAVLVVGFGIGFLASESLRSPPITVVRQQVTPRPPDLPALEPVACEEVDLSRYFR